MKRNPLTIGTLTARVPIIQGGMGIGISLSSLAGAVAKEGGIGVISAAQPGYLEEDFKENPLRANLRALGYHIRRAKELSGGGIIGVNVMCAMRNYNETVQCCVENQADLIISGAGLPMELPALTKGSGIQLAPIVSPVKSAKVILKMWDRRFHVTPDLLVIEGPLAGGHLGYSREELQQYEDSGNWCYDKEVLEILELVQEYEKKYDKKIPVAFAGGVYDGADIDHYISLGCAGVQMASRFVATEECDADLRFKQAYLDARAEDVMIVNSPVGMPGRALRNRFMEERTGSKERILHCYRCLEHCDSATTPYCITGALVRAAKGEVDDALLFCGGTVPKINKIVTVKELMTELCQ